MLTDRLRCKTMRRAMLYRRMQRWMLRAGLLAGAVGMYWTAVVIAVG